MCSEPCPARGQPPPTHSHSHTLIPLSSLSLSPLISVTRFSGVHTLDLHFPGTAPGAPGPARIDFIGFKGTWQPAKREAVVAVYESAPQAADHKVDEC